MGGLLSQKYKLVKLIIGYLLTIRRTSGGIRQLLKRDSISLHSLEDTDAILWLTCRKLGLACISTLKVEDKTLNSSVPPMVSISVMLQDIPDIFH